PAAWTDDATTAGNTNQAATESFTLFGAAAGFRIHLGSALPSDAPESPEKAVVLLQAPPAAHLSDPLVNLSGSATLTVDAVNQLITLDVNSVLSLYYLGTVGHAGGRFVL